MHPNYKQIVFWAQKYPDCKVYYREKSKKAPFNEILPGHSPTFSDNFDSVVVPEAYKILWDAFLKGCLETKGASDADENWRIVPSDEPPDFSQTGVVCRRSNVDINSIKNKLFDILKDLGWTNA